MLNRSFSSLREMNNFVSSAKIIGSSRTEGHSHISKNKYIPNVDTCGAPHVSVRLIIIIGFALFSVG